MRMYVVPFSMSRLAESGIATQEADISQSVYEAPAYDYVQQECGC